MWRFHRYALIIGGIFGIGLVLSATAQAQSYQSAGQDPYLIIQGANPAYTSGDFPAPAPSPRTNDRPSTAYAPPAPSAAAPGRALLGTQTGIQLGLQGSYYDYKEPGYGVSLEGAKFGINPVGTLTLGQTMFLTADLRYALGNSSYKGSGTNPDNFEDLWDLRGLIGHDFIFNPVSLSPYLGFGYRRLYSDDRGITSTGAGGYRRTNELYYLPLGVTPRLRLDNQSRLAASFEYDVLLHGNQNTRLSDITPLYPDLNSHQGTGYGLRGDVSYETGSWALGPFVNYWHIDQSNTSCGQSAFYLLCGVEPQNHTLEAGFQLRYRLL